MPEVDEDWAFYIGVLDELGWTSVQGMGEVPITHQDLYYWQANMKVELDPWEIQLLRQLSSHFLNFRNKGEDLSCPKPYIDRNNEETAEAKSDAIQKGFASIFGGGRIAKTD